MVCAFDNTEAGLLAAASEVRNNFRCKSERVTIGMATGETAVLQLLGPSSRDATRGTDSPLTATWDPPALPSTFVRRPRLVQKLTDASEAPLALIVGPPGYGKSSVVAEWAERDCREFIWLGLDDGRRNGSRRGAEALTQVVRQFSSSPTGFVLVLDDVHRLAARLLDELVKAALAELPAGSTLALVSRTEPPLPVGRLRAHRALVELRLHDLALTAAEGAMLLRGAGVELEFETVQALVRRTEGWPAALYLAVESLQQQPHVFDGLARFSGNDHLVVEYVNDEILSALPAELRSFVLRSAVLDQLSGPLCDAVLEQDSSALTLRKLARSCPLLVSVDPEHHSFRWHRLLKEALESELSRIDPQSALRVHKRASDWFAQNQDEEQAIQHATAAHDMARAGELLWARIPTDLTTARRRSAVVWLAQFTQTEIASCPRLALTAALSCVLNGDVAEGQRWALVAEARLQDGAGPAAVRAQAEIALTNAMLARGGAVRMAEAAEKALRLEPLDSPWRPLVYLLQGVARHLIGDRPEADLALQEGVDCGTPTIAALCLAERAMIAIERNEWALAGELADDADDLIENRGLVDDPICALVAAVAAAARAHNGRTDVAKRDLRRGTDLLSALGDFLPWYGAHARILLAHASLSLADVARARTLLAEASRLARRLHGATMFTQWFDEAWAYLDTLAEASLAGPSSLTIAELRILRFLPTHRSFREIALQLGVSRNTVKTQAHAVYRKLGVTSRSEAVRTASDTGLLGQ